MTDELMELIPGDPDKAAKNLNRKPDVEQNIRAVEAEFIGKPRVCHELVKHIIYIRRGINVEPNTKKFYHLLNNYLATLLEHLNVRWLISVCDTLVDVGDPVQSAVAMNISQCVNQTNIHHSLLINCVDGRLDGNKLRHEIKVPTWGGMISIDIPSGDTVHNMMLRLDRVVATDPLCDAIWKEIKKRGQTEQNVVMNHICGASRFQHQRQFFK